MYPKYISGGRSLIHESGFGHDSRNRSNVDFCFNIMYQLSYVKLTFKGMLIKKYARMLCKIEIGTESKKLPKRIS